MKRWISLILSIMLFVMSLPLMDTEAAAENRNHISRYSVLVLDVSGTARSKIMAERSILLIHQLIM